MEENNKRIIAAVLAVFFLLGVFPSIFNFLSEKKNQPYLQVRLLQDDGKVKILPLEEYLIGVVAAEMPAEFEVEALKAQCVAARTYVLKRIEQNKKHNMAFDVDITEKTQAWNSNQQMLKKWGILNYYKYRRKIARAVEATKGEFLTYNGQIIDAVYFSSCGRKDTERASDVWSGNVEYLTNVPSNEVLPLRFVRNQTFDAPTFYKLLGFKQSPTQFDANSIVLIDRTKAGRVKSLRVLNKVFNATDFRAKLQLPSTDFEWNIDAQKIEFITYGKAHAVGMSQYGANDMAKAGHDYTKILQHFYPGTEIKILN
ncbi:MAG: stage II sporulation protein D [Peptococcaceae bacterium]|nr:stage II sporulation protein D [Peptococcaceae bacterium]